MSEPDTTPDSASQRGSADSSRPPPAGGALPRTLAVARPLVAPRTEWLTPENDEPPAVPGYAILRELGRGGMGIVYQAHDHRRGHAVALKVMQRVDAAALLRFKHEFRALADVSHPNLVTLYELVSDGRLWFFTMELVEGVDFLSFVNGDGPGGSNLSAEEPTTPARGEPAEMAVELPSRAFVARRERLCDGLRQLTAGVLALHEAGLLHRDIKPSNVLVTPRGRVAVLDFGLAVELDATGTHWSRGGRGGGTLAYMAPEQAAGGPVTPAGDWYSVGVVLYRALTGHLPYRGTVAEVLEAKQHLDPPPPRELVADVPADLSDLCAALLCRRPQERPTGRDVLRLLGPTANRVEAPSVARSIPLFGAPFVGRERHLTALHDAFAATRAGASVVLFVHGRSGMGKSELVQRFLHDLGRRDDVAVLAGRCYERESVPFKALDSLVDALSQLLGRLPPDEVEQMLPPDIAALARVFPVLRQVESIADTLWGADETPDRQELRGRAFVALRRLLARLGERHPLVLFIDDLQWGDVDSAALLAELLRPPDPPKLLLLGAYRSEYAASPCLRALLGPRPAHDTLDRRELAVDPLATEEAERLAREFLHGNDAGTRAASIAREAEGSPYFVRELALSEEATAARATLDEVLWRRVTALAEGPRRLLEIVAVSGRPLRLGDACRAAGLVGDERAALTVLTVGRLVRGTGPGEVEEVETYHDRIRETVTVHLPTEQVRGHHHRLAEVLEASSGADPEALAAHFEGAGEAGRAGHYYAAAADRAAEALAFDRAADLYRRALDLRPAEGAVRELHGRLADALANAGRGAEAARAYESACAACPDPERALELRRQIAYQYCISGRLNEGRRALSNVLATVGLTLPATPRHAFLRLLSARFHLWLRGLRYRPRDAARVHRRQLQRIDVSWSASAGLSLFDFIGAAGLQAHNLLLALRAGEPFRLARALAWEAAHLSNAGGPTRGRTAQLLDEAEALARRIEQPYARGLVGLARGAAEFTSGRWRTAAPLLEQAEQTFGDRCTGVAWERDTAHVFHLWSLFYLGELDEMGRRSERLLRDARRRGDLYLATHIGAFSGPMTRLAAGDVEGASALLDESLRQWSPQGFHLQQLTGLMCRTYLDLYAGRGSEAYARLLREWPAIARSQFLRAQTLRVLLWELRGRSALAALGPSTAPGALLRAAEGDARRIARERMPWSAPLAELLGAGVAAARGDRAGACEWLRRAAAGFDAADMGLIAAVARHRLGDLLGDAGRDLRAAAEEWMGTRQIHDPERMTTAFVPLRVNSW